MEQVGNNMLEQTDNISRELETLRSNGMEMQEVRNSVMEKINECL